MQSALGSLFGTDHYPLCPDLPNSSPDPPNSSAAPTQHQISLVWEVNALTKSLLGRLKALQSRHARVARRVTMWWFVRLH